MALLAQGKKKTKYGLDPQNTQWSKDTNKFGQKLLEKMGWEKGKGLGAQENGMTEHIKASYKWDQSGLGAGPQNPDAWVAHQDDFNDLLKMLNSGKKDEAPEEKEKASQIKDGQKRYYGRFSRGRVQTLRTTEDLDCIFGRRKSTSAPTTPSNQSKANSDDDEGSKEDETTENSHGLTTVTSSTSVQDYFAQKMREKKARQQKSEQLEGSAEEGGIHKSSGSEVGPKTEPSVYGMVGFSYCGEDNVKDQEKDSENGKNKSDERSSRGWYESWNLNQNDGDEPTTMKSKRKKKKKDKKAKSDDDDEVENSGHSNKAESEACAPASESTEGGDSSVLPGEVANHEQSSKKKKKKKRKNEGNNSLSVEGGNETEVVDVQSTSCDGVLQITGKCPNQKLERNENKGDDTVNDMMEDSKDCEGTSSKKKKKKRKAGKESEDIGGQETKKRKTSPEVEEISAQDGKSNKKKRKDKKEQLHSENTIENSGVDVGEDSNLRYSENGKKKKRKKGQEKVKDVEMENETLVTPNEVECQSEGESHSDGTEKSPSKQNKQRKPRRKKKKNDSTKVKKSIFPGSNLEDLDGYGVIKAPVEKKEKVAKKGGTAARFIDDKLKQNAILLGGGVSKKKSQSS